jgi:hypothetical protein
MNSDTMARRLAECEGDMRVRWAEIPEEDWRRVSGDREQIIALLERRYGWTREQAQAELDRLVLGEDRAAVIDDPATRRTVEDNPRAQPGDVLGLDTGGETTGLGDTEEDEDERRIAAERAARAAGRDR